MLEDCKSNVGKTGDQHREWDILIDFVLALMRTGGCRRQNGWAPSGPDQEDCSAPLLKLASSVRHGSFDMDRLTGL